MSAQKRKSHGVCCMSQAHIYYNQEEDRIDSCIREGTRECSFSTFLSCFSIFDCCYDILNTLFHLA